MSPLRGLCFSNVWRIIIISPLWGYAYCHVTPACRSMVIPKTLTHSTSSGWQGFLKITFIPCFTAVTALCLLFRILSSARAFLPSPAGRGAGVRVFKQFWVISSLILSYFLSGYQPLPALPSRQKSARQNILPGCFLTACSIWFCFSIGVIW